MAKKATLTVTYTDGRTDVLNPNRPNLLLAMERQFGVQAPEKHEHYMWLAWHGLGRPGSTLDEWLEQVDDIDMSVGTSEDGSEGKDNPS